MIKNCAACKQTFVAKRKEQKYCNTACAGSVRRNSKKCAYCHNVFHNINRDAKCCSRKCSGLYRSEQKQNIDKKLCKICLEIKDISEFTRTTQNLKNRNGQYYKSTRYLSWCKQCVCKHINAKQRTAEYRKAASEKQKYSVRELSDVYMRGLIRNSPEGKRLGIRSEHITSGMVELKREQITIQRLIKELKNGATRTGN